MQYTTEEIELSQELGLRLRKARILKGDKQKHLVARTGISMKIIGRIEKGDPSVSFGRYLKVASALNLLHTLSNTFLEETDPFDEYDREVETAEAIKRKRVRR